MYVCNLNLIHKTIYEYYTYSAMRKRQKIGEIVTNFIKICISPL